MPITETHGGGTIITGEAVRFAQMLAQRSALKLEILGLRHSRGSVAEMIRRQHGLKSKNRKKLLEEFDAYIEANKDLANR